MGRLGDWRRTGRKDEEGHFWLRCKREASYHRSALTLGFRPHWSPPSACAQTPWGLEGQVTLGLLSEHRQRKPLVALLFTVRMTELGPLAIHPDIKIASK